MSELGFCIAAAIDARDLSYVSQVLADAGNEAHGVRAKKPAKTEGRDKVGALCRMCHVPQEMRQDATKEAGHSVTEGDAALHVTPPACVPACVKHLPCYR